MSQIEKKTESHGSNDTVTEMEHTTKKGKSDILETKENENKAIKEISKQWKAKGTMAANKLRAWGERFKKTMQNGKLRFLQAWNKLFTQERKEKIKNMRDAMTAFVVKAKNKTKEALCNFGKKIQAVWNHLLTPKRKAAIKKSWASMKLKGQTAVKTISSYVCKIGQKLKQIWFRIFTEQRRAAIKAKWNGVIMKLQPIYKKLKDGFLAGVNLVQKGWQKLTCEKNKQAVKSRWLKVKKLVIRVVGGIKNKIVRFFRGLKEKETAEGLCSHKVFYISDYEKEAAYLRSMSLKGYHFVRNDGFRFDFIKGEPKNYFYLLDYYKEEPSDEEKKRWQNEGWEDIFHAPVNYEGSWHFFRRELGEGDMLEYNENNDSRLELFERLTKNWQGILSVVALCTVFSIVAICMQVALHGFPWMIAICSVLAFLCLLVFIIYLNMYYRTRLCIIDIQAKQKKQETQTDSENKM